MWNHTSEAPLTDLEIAAESPFTTPIPPAPQPAWVSPCVIVYLWSHLWELQMTQQSWTAVKSGLILKTGTGSHCKSLSALGIGNRSFIGSHKVSHVFCYCPLLQQPKYWVIQNSTYIWERKERECAMIGGQDHCPRMCADPEIYFQQPVIPPGWLRVAKWPRSNSQAAQVGQVRLGEALKQNQTHFRERPLVWPTLAFLPPHLTPSHQEPCWSRSYSIHCTSREGYFWKLFKRR